MKFHGINTYKFQINFLKNEDLIYQKKLGNEFSLQRGFDFAKLEEGDYNVVLSSLNNEYSYGLVK